MISTDFLVKLRDATQMIADAANEQLEKMTPSEVKYDEKDFDSLKWETKSEPKGEYQQTTKDGNNNNELFQGLKKILEDRNGFWQTSSFKYWTHGGNADIVDRRRK